MERKHKRVRPGGYFKEEEEEEPPPDQWIFPVSSIDRHPLPPSLGSSSLTTWFWLLRPVIFLQSRYPPTPLHPSVFICSFLITRTPAPVPQLIPALQLTLVPQ